MKDLLNHLEYTKLFLIITVGMIALTYLVHIMFRKKRIVKYLPGLISIIIGIYGFLTIDAKVIFLDDINNMTIFAIGISVGFIGILVGLIIGIFNKDKYKNNKS